MVVIGVVVHSCSIKVTLDEPEFWEKYFSANRVIEINGIPFKLLDVQEKVDDGIVTVTLNLQEHELPT